MGNRKASHWRRALIGGLAAALLVGLPVIDADAADPPVDVMVIAAHPDDDIIMAGGVTKSALDAQQSVMVAYLTNGDEYDEFIGTTRQGEGVAAQNILGNVPGGTDEDNLIFLGYPSTYLDCIRYPGAGITGCEEGWEVGLPSAVTYASRGLGGTDWHNYWTGSHADFTWTNVNADMYELLDTYRPADIYTHVAPDKHSDHRITFYAVMEAIDAIPNYDPVVHAGLVHINHSLYPEVWPDFSGGLPHMSGPNDSATLAITPTEVWPDDPAPGMPATGDLIWEQREVVPVPGVMLSNWSGSNLKYEAVAAHATQFDDTQYLIQRFIHSDEVFWTYVVGSAVGIDDSYSLDEGGTLDVGGAGLLTNDIRGTGSIPGAPLDPTPLGALQANQVSSPSHGSLTLQSDGSFTYAHDGSENFTDSFTYRPRQGSTLGSTARVNIDITPIDEDPTADDDGPYNTANGESVNVPAPGVLDGDSDPEGASLSAELVSDVAHGTLSLNSNGSFTYTHDGTDTLTDSFTYIARDPGGNTSSPATVSLTIDPAGYVPPLVVSMSGPTMAAKGVAQTFSPSVSGGEGTRSYLWTAKQNGSVVASSMIAGGFSFTPGTSGDYDVSLVVSDDTGSASDSATLKVLGDIADSPFVGDIIWLADAGITKGCNPPTNDLFCPNANVTRGQMAAFLVRFLGLTDDGGGDLFVDDNGSVFESDIDKLATAGVTAGCNPPVNDRFCPNDYVTRGQMAAFLVRALDLTDDGGGDLFTDDNGSIFEGNIDKMATAGITKGCNPPANTLFCPNGFVTRGQMAAFLHRTDGLTGS